MRLYATQNVTFNRRREAGLCLDCEVPAPKGNQRCPKCAAIPNAKRRAARAEQAYAREQVAIASQPVQRAPVVARAPKAVVVDGREFEVVWP